MIDHRQVLREADGMVQRYLEDLGANADGPRRARQRGEIDRRRGDAVEARVLMLDEKEVLVAAALGELGIGDVLLQRRRRRRRPAVVGYLGRIENPVVQASHTLLTASL